jgi:hypothetical protein
MVKKKENHFGASMVAVKDSREIHINTQETQHHMYSTPSRTLRNKPGRRLDSKPSKKTSSYAINVDSKAALLAIANKHTTHPLAVATRFKTIQLRTFT